MATEAQTNVHKPPFQAATFMVKLKVFVGFVGDGSKNGGGRNESRVRKADRD